MSAKKKIQAIVFDLGGVLVHGGYLDFIKHYCLACLTPLGKKKILDLERQVNLGRISEKEFYQAIKQVFGVHLTVRQMHKLIVHKMSVDRGLVKAIPNLGTARVVLFTNAIGQMTLEIFRRYRISPKKLFDKVFVSAKLHRVKPDGSTYRYILRRLKVPPSAALMVDDRLLNIRGARKIGMQGIVYKNLSQFRKAIKKYEFV